MRGWYNIHKSINVIHHISKIRDKNCIIILIDSEKAFDKIQHLFMTETLSKMETEGTHLNITKAIYEKPTAGIILKGKKTISIPHKIGNKTGMSAFTSLI